jgi:hypothetical protein
MKYLPAILVILASPVAAHDGAAVHTHTVGLLIPAVVAVLSLASVAIALRRLTRSRT